ncbi:MAG: ATP-binding protein [Elusimicrobiota bacterium]
MANHSYIKRYLEEVAFSDVYSRQMRFIAGPRQSGKTTIAKNQLLSFHSEQLYYNWDRKQVRDRYRKESDFLGSDYLNMASQKKLWVCFDEIHKIPKWKNILKDFFDTYENKINLIVTGSARFDLFRRAGDSLAGRYFLFKLNPLMLSEVLAKKIENILPGKTADEYIEKSIAVKKYEQAVMEDILQFSSFPEPLISGNSVFSKKWHDNYLERIVKEDLRDLSSIHQLEKVIDLLYILPSKIGSPLSINSLKEDLEINFSTVKNYINYLILTYMLFEVFPYQKKIKRLVKKEKKIYFYDHAIITEEAKKFENLVAVELKSRIDLWNDLSEDKYDLKFVRTKDGNETDFLILKNSQPFFLCEAKLSDDKIARHHYLHSKHLGDIPFVQVVKKTGTLKVEQGKFYVVSASRFFS